MQTASAKYPPKLFKAILFTGLLASTLDALAAIIDFYIATDKNPAIVFVYIASGALGKQAYVDSKLIALLGLFFHYCFAISFSAFYFLIYPRLKFLQWNKINSAVIYGIFVWFVMNIIVVPGTKASPIPFHVNKAILAVVILIICIGFPDSFRAASFYKKLISFTLSS